MMGINTTHLYYFRIWWCYRAKFIRFFSLKRDSPENKKPRLSEVLSGFCGWSPQNTLCYVNAKSIRDRRRTRNSGTDFDVFEYGSPSRFCPQNTVHTYSIYLYWGCSQWARGPQFYRRNEVLAETGGAVSALTPEVSTLCYVNPGAGNRRRKGTPASCSF